MQAASASTSAVLHTCTSLHEGHHGSIPRHQPCSIHVHHSERDTYHGGIPRIEAAITAIRPARAICHETRLHTAVQ